MKDDGLLNIDRLPIADRRCARCGLPIGPHNDSGWMVAVLVGSRQVWQPVCWLCDELRDKGPMPKEMK